MKVKKIIAITIVLITICVSLIQCAEDDLEELNGVNFGVKPKFKIEIEHSEFLYLKNKNLDKLVNFTKLKNKNEKLFSPVYNFEIDEHLVQTIEFEDYTTYTYQVKRNNQTENKLENYIVKMNGNNVIAHYLVGYPYQVINNNKVFNYNASTIISLENPNWVPQNKSVSCPPGEAPFIENIESFSVPVLIRCTGAGNHLPNDPNCNCGKRDFTCIEGRESVNTTTIITWTCGSTVGGSTSGNGNGGSGQIVTTPFTPFLNPEKTDCEELKELTDSTKQNIKPILEDLKILAGSSLQYENGYLFKKDANGNRTNEAVVPDTNSNYSIPIKTGGTIFAAAHTHTYELFQMYSWSDLYVLLKLYQGSSVTNKTEVTLMLLAKDCLTCATVSVYTLKINDFNKFRAKINSDLNNSNTAGYSDADKFKYANDNFRDLYTNNMNNTQLEKAFLEYWKGHGISMYKANDDLSNWDKVELSRSPLTPVVKTPCN